MTSTQGIFTRINIRPEAWILALAFLANLLLVSPDLLPGYPQINGEDEAKYIDSGRSLLRGQLREFSWGPLVALVYAPFYLVFKNQSYWFFNTAAAGRFVLFGLLWWSALLLATKLKRHFPPLLMAGFIFIYVTPSVFFWNSSDVLFAALSGFSLAHTMSFYETSHWRYARLASLFIGLGALTRPDGLLLFGSFLLILLVLAWRKRGFWHAIPVGVLPFTLLVCGFLLLTSSDSPKTPGNGVLGRTYQAFEQGQWVTGLPWDMAYQEARKKFGTPAENDYNVLKAILRHPQAYLERLRIIVKSILPDQLLNAYGKRTGGVLFFLAAVGIVALIRQKAFPVLLILLLWPLHLGAYFLTFFREGYLLLPYFIFFILAAKGLDYLVIRPSTIEERLFWSFILLISCVLTVLTNKMAVTMGLSLFTLGLWIAWTARHLPALASQSSVAGLLILFATGLVIHGNYPYPNYHTLGTLSEEKAVRYLFENFPKGSNVAVFISKPALAARMNPVYLDGPAGLRTAQELASWLQAHDVQAIFIDGGFRSDRPELWKLISNQVGVSLSEVFLADPGSIQILVPGPQRSP